MLETDAGRSNIQFSPLYASAAALTATFLRVDIPMLLDPTKHGEVVLYADADLVFLRDVRREDFGAGADPAYFTMGAEFAEPPIYGNAGVMLLNLEGLRKTYDQFVDWTFSEANVQRGLHFGDFGPGDQGAYAEFYEGAFTIVREQPLFNWRPYWRSRRSDPAILHFHGPKPDQYRAGLGGRWEAPWDSWPPLQRCRRQGSPCADWLKVYDCLPAEVGAAPSAECEKLLAPSAPRHCVPLEATAACTDAFRPPNPDPSAKAFCQPPDVRDCRPDDVAARLHTECAGWNEKDPLKRFTDEHRAPVLNEVIDRGVHVCTKQGSDEIIRAASRRRRLLGLVH